MSFFVRGERKTRVEPGISGKVTIIDGTALLVLTFKEEELDLSGKKPGDNGDDDGDDDDDVDDDDDLMLLPARNIPGG